MITHLRPLLWKRLRCQHIYKVVVLFSNRDTKQKAKGWWIMDISSHSSHQQYLVSVQKLSIIPDNISDTGGWFTVQFSFFFFSCSILPIGVTALWMWRHTHVSNRKQCKGQFKTQLSDLISTLSLILFKSHFVNKIWSLISQCEDISVWAASLKIT